MGPLRPPLAALAAFSPVARWRTLPIAQFICANLRLCALVCVCVCVYVSVSGVNQKRELLASPVGKFSWRRWRRHRLAATWPSSLSGDLFWLLSLSFRPRRPPSCTPRHSVNPAASAIFLPFVLLRFTALVVAVLHPPESALQNE